MVTTQQKPLVYNVSHLDASTEILNNVDSRMVEAGTSSLMNRDGEPVHSRFCSGDSMCLNQEP